MSRTDSAKPLLRIVGGGFAGIEAALALAALAPGLAETSLISPDPDFVYKPLVVAEPFGGEPSPHERCGGWDSNPQAVAGSGFWDRLLCQFGHRRGAISVYGRA